MHSNNTIHKDKLFYSLILLMISPVVAMFTSILNFSFREARWILVLFFGIFGMTMIILDGKDAKVHSDFFISSYVDKDLETFISETKNIILLQPIENEGLTNDDLYIHIMSFFVGKFSANPALLFFLVSIIYGFFYIRGVGLVYDHMNGRWSFALTLIFLFFIFWKSLEGINSIRNWTGAWIFFNGAFSYFQTREKKFLLLVLLAPMIHFAYILIALPFYVILIFGNWPVLYFLILVFSFFISVESVDIIQEYIQLTELGSQKIGYIKEGSSEEYLLDKAAKTTFYAKYYLAAGKLVVTVLFFYALLFFGYLKKEGHNYLLMSLGSMGILMITFSNIVSFSVTINNRIFTNGALYVLAYVLILYTKKFNEGSSFSLFGFDIVTYISIPLILLFMYTQWSHIGDFTDAKIFVSPIVYWIFEGDYSLKELLRELFS